MRCGRFAVVALSLGMGAFAATHATAATMPVQGVVRDNAGNAVPQGAFRMSFRLYDGPEASEALWHETHPSGEVDCSEPPTDGCVTVRNGVFTARLGTHEELPTGLFRDHDGLWLGVSVEGEPELPRRPLGAVGRALYAERASVAEGVACSGCIDASALQGVDGLELADRNGDDARWRLVEGSDDGGLRLEHPVGGAPPLAISTEGDLDATGTVTAEAFSGDGSALTGVEAASIAGRTVEDASCEPGDVLQVGGDGAWECVPARALTGPILEESFDGGTIDSGWSIGSCNTCEIRSKGFLGQGYYQDASEGDKWQDVLRYDFEPSLKGSIRASYYFWETSNNHDGAMWFRNCSGDNIASAGTENPQWEIINNAGDQVEDGGQEYQHWVHVTMTLDVDANQFTATFEDTADGEQKTYGPVDFGAPTDGICRMGLGPDEEWYVDEVRVEKQ